jgi:hypothetical protein
MLAPGHFEEAGHSGRCHALAITRTRKVRVALPTVFPSCASPCKLRLRPGKSHI